MPIYNREALTGQGFYVVEIDELGTGNFNYTGYSHPDGRWVIAQDNIAVTSVMNSRFAKGDTGFSTNWTNRAALTYGYPYEVWQNA